MLHAAPRLGMLDLGDEAARAEVPVVVELLPRLHHT